MNDKEMIEHLKKKGYKIEEPDSRFLEVQHSEENFVLLENEDKDGLVVTWLDEESLNDFEYFKKRNHGHFWIRGDVNKVELLIDGKRIVSDKQIFGRFLK